LVLFNDRNLISPPPLGKRRKIPTTRRTKAKRKRTRENLSSLKKSLIFSVETALAKEEFFDLAIF